MRHTRRAIHAALTTSRALAAAAQGTLGLLRYATEAGLTVRISYVKEDGTASVRDVRPELVRPSQAGNWYTTTRCLLRGERRSFRLDRITACTTA